MITKTDMMGMAGRMSMKGMSNMYPNNKTMNSMKTKKSKMKSSMMKGSKRGR